MSYSFQSDGEWLWPQSLNHDLIHGICLPAELADHIRAMNYIAPEAIDIDIRQLPFP